MPNVNHHTMSTEDCAPLRGNTDRLISLIVDARTAGELRPAVEIFHERDSGGFEARSLLAVCVREAGHHLLGRPFRTYMRR